MSSPAQIPANRSNSQASTGPVTPEGKAAVSRNATKRTGGHSGHTLCATTETLGLFSLAAFVRPEEQSAFDELNQACIAELRPESTLEHTLVREIIHASWRLRRCAQAESSLPEDASPEDLDRLQASIDRARTAAQRTFHRSLAELRRLRAEPAPVWAHWEAELRRSMAELKRLESPLPATPDLSKPDSAKRSQSERVPAPAPAPMIARNAPCPCGSGEKYKRCCGRSAPPVLGAPAAARSAEIARERY